MRRIRTYLGYFKRLLASAPAEQALMFEVFVISNLTEKGFRLAGVSSTQAFLRRLSTKRASCPNPDETIATVLRTQRAVAQVRGTNGTCLTRSMALWTLLVRRGVAAEIRVGIRKPEKVIEAHAWVEYEGKPLNEADSEVRSYEVMSGLLAFDKRP
jgi:hypothetical protein